MGAWAGAVEAQAQYAIPALPGLVLWLALGLEWLVSRLPVPAQRPRDPFHLHQVEAEPPYLRSAHGA